MRDPSDQDRAHRGDRPSDDRLPRLLRHAFAGLALVGVLFLLLGGDPLGFGFAERAGSGKNLRPLDYAAAFVWWITLVNVAALLTLVLAWNRLVPFGAPARDPRFTPSTKAIPRLVAGTVLISMVWLLVSAAPRLDDALWTDEKYMVIHSIAGRYEPGDDGRLRFAPVSWADTFFYYRKPNNHVPYSIAARLSWGAWQTIVQPDDERAEEIAVRLPALFAGVAALGTLAWLLARLGFAWAGAGAAALLAFHPWYLRYVSEARGYAFLFALLPLSVITAHRVLEKGTWPRWAIYGALQVLLLWTYPGAIFVPVVLNAWLAWQIWRARDPSSGTASPMGRFLLTNVLSGLAWLQLNFANMIQFLAYSEEWQNPLTMAWFRNTSSLLLLGLENLPKGAGYVTLDTVIVAHPFLLTAVVCVALIASLIGLLGLLRAGPAGRGSALVLLAPAPLTILFAMARGDHLYPWYVIHGLPGLFALIGVGLIAWCSWLRSARARLAGTAAMVIAFVAAFAFLTAPMRELLRSRDIQPTFEVLAYYGWPRHADPREPRPFISGAVYGANTYYDPGTRVVTTPDEVHALMREADDDGRPLFVSFNRAALARRRRASSVAVLEQERWFEHMRDFDAVYPKYRRSVFRYRPGSIGEFPPSAVVPAASPTGESPAGQPPM